MRFERLLSDQRVRRALSLGVVGGAAGVLSGLLGIGGGIVMVPAMVTLVGLTQHQAHATSLAAIIPIATAGALIFGGASNVDLRAAGILIVGSLIGVQLGLKVMGRLTDERLGVAFGVLLVAIGAAMLR